MLKVNINSATIDELANVPGIGPSLAQKVIENRPYESLDDLKKVPGIGDSSFEKLKPNLTIISSEVPADFQSFMDSIRDDANEQPLEEESLSDEQPPEENIQELVDGEVKVLSEDASPEEEPVVAESMQETPSKIVEVEMETDAAVVSSEPQSAPKSDPEPSESMVTRSQLIWSLVGTGVFSIILTILITLGILSATNGGLQYATTAEAARLDNQITILNDLATNMQNDIAGIRTRLDALETVADRVTVLEGRADSVEEEIGTLQTSLNEITDTLSTVQEQIKTLQDEAQKSQTLRSGLLDLLMQIENPTGEGN